MPAWTPNMSVGVAKLDSQHQRLLEVINLLLVGINAGRGQDVLGPVLISLLQYTKVHFGEEEALLAEHGYPMLDEHVKIHGRFRQKVEELRVRLHEGKNSTAASILSFLGDWLAEHILGVDAQYRDFLASKGVQ